PRIASPRFEPFLSNGLADELGDGPLPRLCNTMQGPQVLSPEVHLSLLHGHGCHLPAWMTPVNALLAPLSCRAASKIDLRRERVVLYSAAPMPTPRKTQLR